MEFDIVKAFENIEREKIASDLLCAETPRRMYNMSSTMCNLFEQLVKDWDSRFSSIEPKPFENVQSYQEYGLSEIPDILIRNSSTMQLGSYYFRGVGDTVNKEAILNGNINLKFMQRGKALEFESLHRVSVQVAFTEDAGKDIKEFNSWVKSKVPRMPRPFNGVEVQLFGMMKDHKTIDGDAVIMVVSPCVRGGTDNQYLCTIHAVAYGRKEVNKLINSRLKDILVDKMGEHIVNMLNTDHGYSKRFEKSDTFEIFENCEVQGGGSTWE